MVMRVKKITSPIETVVSGYDGWVPKPVEGELVMNRRTNGKLGPWCLDADAIGNLGMLALFRDSGET